jgi:hypothetical protein
VTRRYLGHPTSDRHAVLFVRLLRICCVKLSQKISQGRLRKFGGEKRWIFTLLEKVCYKIHLRSDIVHTNCRGQQALTYIENRVKKFQGMAEISYIFGSELQLSRFYLKKPSKHGKIAFLRDNIGLRRRRKRL